METWFLKVEEENNKKPAHKKRVKRGNSFGVLFSMCSCHVAYQLASEEEEDFPPAIVYLYFPWGRLLKTIPCTQGKGIHQAGNVRFYKELFLL